MAEGETETLDRTLCGKCGEVITGEPSNGDPAERHPCPKCGSTSRKFESHVQSAVTASMTAHAQIVTYPQALLTVAQSLIDQGQFSIAVVVAVMACEVAAERSLSDAFVTRSVQYLEEPVTEFLNGYNLANERIRKFYTALTGDEVQNAAFWQNFKSAAWRRNRIIHGGLIVGKHEAEESCKAANDLVEHLKK